MTGERQKGQEEICESHNEVSIVQDSQADSGPLQAFTVFL